MLSRSTGNSSPICRSLCARATHRRSTCTRCTGRSNFATVDAKLLDRLTPSPIVRMRQCKSVSSDPLYSACPRWRPFGLVLDLANGCRWYCLSLLRWDKLFCSTHLNPAHLSDLWLLVMSIGVRVKNRFTTAVISALNKKTGWKPKLPTR